MVGDINYANNESPDVEEDFENDLMRQEPKDYCRYISFKIQNYIEICYNDKISFMNLDFLMDDIGTIFLIDIHDILSQLKT